MNNSRRRRWRSGSSRSGNSSWRLGGRGAEGTSCTVVRRLTVGPSPIACLKAQRLIGSFDFLRPDNPGTSSLFLFTKIVESLLNE